MIDTVQRCDNDFQQMSENRGFNGGLIDLRVLRRGSQREKKSLQKKKKKENKTGRQQEGSRCFYELDEILEDRVYYTG